jgi:hypothetical protein
MNFIQGQIFFYGGRKFKVLSKWMSGKKESEWDIDFIEDGTEEVQEVKTRKFGFLFSLWKKGEIK